MTIDAGWNTQAVTALDLSAMSASESIVLSSQASDEHRPPAIQEHLGGLYPPQDLTELTTGKVYDSEGPAMPLRVSGAETDYASGLIRPVANTGEGTALDQYRDYMGLNQLDRAYSSNLAALTFTDTFYQGRIVDYTA